jgi:hypothetical protein
MTDKQNDKGNGGAKESTVTVRFPSPGAADPLDVKLEGASPGQLAVAAVWLFSMAIFNVFSAMGAQQVQAAKEQAMVDSLMGKM